MKRQPPGRFLAGKKAPSFFMDINHIQKVLKKAAFYY
jgi:hypothetical protein